MDISREDITRVLKNMNLDWGDEEDAETLVGLLLERFELLEVYTWLFFYNTEFGASPLTMLEMGKSREVFKAARGLVASGRE
jgi:hypothetical protein